MKSIIAILILFFAVQTTFSLNCDTVASLPDDFNTLLPQYDKLNRIHLQNFFFIEEDQKQLMKINLRGKSIFK